MSIGLWAQVVVLLMDGYIGLLGQVLYFGRASRTRETLPDFRERCRVNRHPRVFRGLTDSQQTPRIWGVTKPFPSLSLIFFEMLNVLPHEDERFLFTYK